MNRWYVAQTQARAEMVAMQNLMNQEFEAFLPLAHRRIKRRRKLVEDSVPLYPGYVFIRFDTELHRWRSINGTRGIQRLMTDANEHPRSIPVGLIEKLIVRSHNGEFDEIAGVVKFSFRAGSHLTITDGPLSGFEGVCIDALVDQVRILLDIFGRKTEVRIPVGSVECAA